MGLNDDFKAASVKGVNRASGASVSGSRALGLRDLGSRS